MIDTASLRQKLIDLAVFGWHGRALKSEALPAGWTWTTLGNLTELITSGSRSWAQYYVDEKTDSLFLRMGNLSRGSFDLRLDELQYVALPKNAEGTRTSVLFGDLLFSITAEIGMMGLIPEKFPTAYINQHTALIRFKPEFRGKYFPYCLLTTFAREQYESNKHGLKSSFRLDQIADIKVPLPPIAEQQSIVKRLEELLALEREIAADSAALDDLITAAKRKILQLAVTGKLSAECRVRSAEGGATTDSTDCTDGRARTPAAPPGWKMVKLGEISRQIGTKQHQIQTKEIIASGKYPVVSQGQGLIDGYSDDEDKSISDLPLILFGDHTKNVKFIDFEFVVGADGTKLFAPNDGVDAKWLYYFTTHAAFEIGDRGYGRHWGLLNKLPIPLPPLVEQKAIVAKVEELFAVLDAMRN